MERIGVCSKGGENIEKVVALINIYFKALEALYEGYAQKGLVLILDLDGSPFPLGSLWGRWKSLDDHRDVITPLWIKKQSNPKQINICDNQ
jgi:hypothetical protein